MLQENFWKILTKLAWYRTDSWLSCRKTQWSAVASGPRVDTTRQYFTLKRNPQKNNKELNACRSLMAETPKRDASLPKLIYLQYPLKYLKAKLGLWRLRHLWDPAFDEGEFKIGSKQAAVVMADSIRNQDLLQIFNLATESGYKQIARDMILSRQDPRLQLLKFRSDDIKRAIPVRVYLIERDGRKHCIIDMFFVGMRNILDFNTHESVEIQDSIRKYDALGKPHFSPKGDAELDDKDKRRIVFAEIFTRFYREYSEMDLDDWAVAFYKIATFDVLDF